jgi:hypothetical protein
VDRDRVTEITLSPQGLAVVGFAAGLALGLYLGYFLGLFEGFVTDEPIVAPVKTTTRPKKAAS